MRLSISARRFFPASNLSLPVQPVRAGSVDLKGSGRLLPFAAFRRENPSMKIPDEILAVAKVPAKYGRPRALPSATRQPDNQPIAKLRRTSIKRVSK